MRFFSLATKIVACGVVLLLSVPCHALLSSRDKNLLGNIGGHFRAGRYDTALKSSHSLDNKDAKNYVYWKYLTSSDTVPSFQELNNYMVNNPNMPYQHILKAKLENTVSEVDNATQSEFFKHHRPRTIQGRIAFINFMFNNNQKKLAIQNLKEIWQSETLSNTQQTKFFDVYKSYLTVSDHSKRIRYLIDTNQRTAAHLLLKYGTREDAIKFNLRQKLGGLSSLGLIAYNNSSNSVKQDAGVLRSLVYYYRKSNKDIQAMNVMANLTALQSKDNPEAWYESRAILSRVAFKEKRKRDAYKIIANHNLTEGANYVDAEFYAGWLALRYLGDKKTALQHFKNGRSRSTLPVSVSRFEYWIGRACEALNDTPCEKIAYTNASKYFYTFYGQLAGYNLNLINISIPKFPKPTPQIEKAYFNDSVIQATYAAHALGSDTDTQLMLTSVAERVGKHPAIFPLLEKTVREIGNLKMRVKLSKAASINNDFLLDTGYPIINLRQTANVPELALVYALTRQESEYNANAQSPVGAKGLMQIMPRTAMVLAKQLRMSYHPSYLSRPDYNMTLGSFYVKSLINQFRGSYIHALSGYNAGPGRIGQWNQSYGYFKNDLNLIIDRIETIPFGETRNYVQRILESVQVYRAKLTNKDYISTENLVNDLKRGL